MYLAHVLLAVQRYSLVYRFSEFKLKDLMLSRPGMGVGVLLHWSLLELFWLSGSESEVVF